MKTTSEQLLARAEELEARARALRISAAEMNGHQTAEKQGKVKELFQAATKIRRAVKQWDASDAIDPPEPGLPPLTKKKRYKPSELAPYVLAALDGATRTTIELRDLLADQGAPAFGTGHVRSLLERLPQVKRAGGGTGTDVRWQLRRGSQSEQPLRAAPRKQKKWSPAQHKKFRASMKRINAAKRAAATAATTD